MRILSYHFTLTNLGFLIMTYRITDKYYLEPCRKMQNNFIEINQVKNKVKIEITSRVVFLCGQFITRCETDFFGLSLYLL